MTSLRASGTGAAEARAGAVAVSGIVHGDVTVGAQPTPRSGYGEQVRRIAPDLLVGREQELREMAAFCTTSDAGPYVWWQAGPWAGKTALMAWFALHPPAGVRIVPFFVTARFAAQNDRVAFTDVVLEQLAELLGESPAVFLTPSTREAHVLRLLKEAADRCDGRGERLILLVDGLDEDRGVTTGPDAYSIAALLPARPPSGLRVIVAGRPDPPVPSDVPEHHPLRDPGIVRPLPRSSVAQVIRAEAQRELKQLLVGHGAERDLLGLLTASGGGLGAAELAELTGLGQYDVEELLHSRAGRTFRVRESHTRPGQLPPVLVLGHEELLDQAVRMLGPRELGAYRDRIHSWADRYAAGRWPTDTPEYLLRGYFSMLQATADLSRMAVLAADCARHDRMRELTGGDTAALTEIRVSQYALAEGKSPNLTLLLRLAARRDALHARNARLPVELPGVWVAMGQPRRAEALARSLGEPPQRARALSSAAQALADTGALSEADALFAEAAESARAEPDSVRQVEILTEVARAWWPTGPQEAEALLREATERAGALAASSTRAAVLMMTAQGWHATGDRNRTGAALSEAVALARQGSLDETWQRTSVLAGAGRILHDLGEAEQAENMWAEAEALACGSAPGPASALIGIAWGLRDRPEQRVRMMQLLDLAETVARSGNPKEVEQRDWTLLELGIVLSAAGCHERAVGIAQDTAEKDQLLAFVSKDLAERGELGRAEALARSIDDSGQRSRGLTSVTKALITQGRYADAEILALESETLARETVDALSDARSLIWLGGTVAATGERDRALALLDEAETVLRAHADNSDAERVADRLGDALVEAGELTRAEALARTITDPLWRVRLLIRVGRATAEASDHAHAVEVLEEAAEVAASLADSTYRAYEIAHTAEALAAAGAGERAVTLARTAEHPGQYGNPALDRVGKELGVQGDLVLGTAVLTECETEARKLPNPGERIWRLGLVAEGLAACGHPDRAAGLLAEAEAESRRTVDSEALAECLTEVGAARVACGDQSRARVVLTEAAEIARTLQASSVRDRSLARIGEVLVSTGAHQEAEQLVDDLVDPVSRARVLNALAKALPAEPARRIVARCLCVAPWRDALDGLAAAAPTSLVAFTDEEYGGVAQTSGAR